MRSLPLLRIFLAAAAALCILLFAVDSVLFYRLHMVRASAASAAWLVLFALPAIQLFRNFALYTRLLAGETVAELDPRTHAIATFTILPAALALAAMLVF